MVRQASTWELRQEFAAWLDKWELYGWSSTRRPAAHHWRKVLADLETEMEGLRDPLEIGNTVLCIRWLRQFGVRWEETAWEEKAGATQ